MIRLFCVLVSLTLVSKATAECVCEGTDDQPGLIKCVNRQYEKELDLFRQIPLGEDDTTKACEKDLTDVQKEKLAELKGKLKGCGSAKEPEGTEADEKKTCAYKAMKDGCENPEAAPQYLKDKVEKHECGKEEEQASSVSETVARGWEKRLFGGCRVRDKAKLLNEKVRETYPELTGYFDCVNIAKCEEKKAGVKTMGEDCEKESGCDSTRSFGAFYNAYTKCLKNLSDSSKSKVTTRCKCIAENLGLDKDKYCTCD